MKGLQILLVEDNELNMEITEYIMTEQGAVVTEAWNGKEAVDIYESCESGTFDVILMDIMMPVMNGLEAARCIRASEKEDAQSIPIIAISANAFNVILHKPGGGYEYASGKTSGISESY